LLVLGAMTAAYALLFGAIVSIKFRYYLYSDFDLAIFVQATDQILHGSLFVSIRGMNWLGDHVSLILFALAPIYAILRHPLTLLLLQTLALALGALPVFAIARREIGHEGIALTFAGLYLLHPAIGYTNLFEFHPEVLATGTLLATFWALGAGRFWLTALFAILSLACREDVALVVMMMGLASLLPGRPRRFAGLLIGLAIVSLVLSFAVIRPAFATSAASYVSMYEHWGKSLQEVARGVLMDPLRAIGALVSSSGDADDTALKRLYWPHMLGPLLFLPLLSPLTLAITLPVLAEHFLSSRVQQHWMLYQYTALVTPVMVVAAARGLGNLMRWLAPKSDAAAPGERPGRARSIGTFVAGAAVVASVIGNLFYGPLLRREWISVPQLPEPNWPSAYDRTRRPFRDRAVARIPREGGVVAGFEYLARLASRTDVHAIHHIYLGYYTYSTRPYPIPTGITGMLVDFGDPRLAAYVRPETSGRLRDLVAGNDLRPAQAAGDLVLFLRAATDTAELVRAGIAPPAGGPLVTYDQQVAYAGFALPESTVAAGGTLPVETWWRRVAPADRMYMLQLLLRDGEGETKYSVVRHLGYLVYPVSSWPADTSVRETYRMVVPTNLRPGVYSLGLRLARWREGFPVAPPPDDPTLVGPDLIVPLGRITVTRPGGR
jgi:uncharacterized membrane protein